ncbi:MAG: phage major capsid protein, partial [Chloroflexi bacterium]|nr:phage major capsid protein [Chloroflexota bacterium]
PAPPAQPSAADRRLAAFRSFLLDGPRALSVMEPALRATLQADNDIGGGFLTAPEEFVNMLLQGVDNQVFIRQRVAARGGLHQVEGADSLGVPTLDTDLDDPDWTTELGTGSEDTAMEFGKRALRPHPLAKRIKVARTLLRRSRLGVDRIIRDRLSYKFGVAMENNYLNGTGANRPLGMFVASDQGIGTGRDVTCGAVVADVIAGDDLITALYTLKPQYHANAVWIMHRDLARKIRQLKTSDNYLWQAGLSGAPATILDLPYILSEYAPNTFTANQYIALLGDLGFYWIADAIDTLEVQVLTELYAETNRNGYIARLESDGMPVLAEAFVRVKMAAA